MNRTMAKSKKRQQIIGAAFELFGKNGFYATGVDLIMQTAGVSKRTLYKYFPTKNDLIVAVLDFYRTTYQEHLDNILEAPEKTSREKILAIFDDARSSFGDANFHGCLAVNAMGEFSGKNQDIESSCQRFKQWELGVLRNLTSDLEASNSDPLAYKLFMLLEGMVSFAQVTKGPYPIDMTQMADDLIENHIS